MERNIRYFLLQAVVITAIFISMYVVVQQLIRQSANYPQTQISEDIANTLASGSDPSLQIPQTNIDIAHSLSPFVIVYDELGRAISSNAYLDGTTPELPQGVLQTAKDHGQNRVTWAPRQDVRIASVVTYYFGKAKGYVLAGRSLREEEMKVDRLSKLILFGWFSTLLISFVATMTFLPKRSK